MPRKAARLTSLIDPETGEVINGYALGPNGEQRLTPTGMPDEVRVRGERWRVLYFTQLFAVERNKAIALYGFCHAGHRLIVLNAAEPRLVMIETLYHEMAHVYLRKHVGSKSYRQLMKLCEEELCDLFAECVADLTTNNLAPR